MHFSQVTNFINDLLRDLAGLSTELILLAVIVVAAVIVIDAVTMFARKEKEQVGIGRKSSTVSIDGGKTVPVRDYVSEIQGLAGRPDALISEHGYIIPIERKPLARKLRDRYVAQLLVYMRLVEEFEGKKPPYGYLILGPACRKIRIDNTSERQAWLQGMIDEMRDVLDGASCKPTPHPKKCAKCDVVQHCHFAILTPINIKKGPAHSRDHAK